MKKKALLVTSMAVVLLSAAASASAQSSSSVVRADIPFDFQVGNETFQAGEYDVRTAAPSGAVLRIEEKSGGHGLLTATIPTGIGRMGEARLVFNKYGDQYFLREVWDGSGGGKSLLKSKRERMLRRELRHVARGAGAKAVEPEVVVVTARRDTI